MQMAYKKLHKAGPATLNPSRKGQRCEHPRFPERVSCGRSSLHGADPLWESQSCLISLKEAQVSPPKTVYRQQSKGTIPHKVQLREAVS